MKFLSFRFRRTEKTDLVMKGLMGAMPQNFWARTAPGVYVITITKKQESMLPPSADTICGHPSSCRASHVQAPTVIRPNDGVGLVCSRRRIRVCLIGHP